MKNIGFMYLDNDTKKTLQQKINECGVLYEKRHGKKNNQCFVNLNKDIQVEYIDDNGVRIIPLKNILKDHFWLGEDIV